MVKRVDGVFIAGFAESLTALLATSNPLPALVRISSSSGGPSSAAFWNRVFRPRRVQTGCVSAGLGRAGCPLHGGSRRLQDVLLETVSFLGDSAILSASLAAFSG